MDISNLQIYTFSPSTLWYGEGDAPNKQRAKIKIEKNAKNKKK
jgi:hypothetical protein